MAIRRNLEICCQSFIFDIDKMLRAQKTPRQPVKEINSEAIKKNEIKMAVYLHIYNLILCKKAVEEKYIGGIEQFRIDYKMASSEINQEDDELFCLGQMNADEFDIDRLVNKGLSFEEAKQNSNDFTILDRYGDFFWEVNWLQHNRVFAWHTETSPDLLLKVEEISNMTLSDIHEQIEKGINVFNTIRKQAL
jgi:hypothetical protein